MYKKVLADIYTHLLIYVYHTHDEKSNVYHTKNILTSENYEDWAKPAF